MDNIARRFSRIMDSTFEKDCFITDGLKLICWQEAVRETTDELVEKYDKLLDRIKKLEMRGKK